ncbi:MAG: glycosyltransferase [Chloroflexi bacterium]|nr:glycosyltransferase [Chloroflexota bacterium]
MKAKKRILFLMSDTGGGHRAAAEAIRDALMMQHGDAVSVRIVDVFKDYSTFPFKYFPDFYPWIVNSSKTSYGWSFKLSNTRNRARVIARGMYVTAESKLKRMVREHPADVVVCVHSIVTRPAMHALMAGQTRPPFVVVVTDLVSTHYFWYDKRAERTLVPTPLAFERGVLAGLDPARLRITGLPVHPQFTQALTDQATARAELGWNPDLPAILVIGGGDGLGPLEKTARAINSRKLRCQLAVIAGRNEALKAKLASRRWKQPTYIYGFVDDMPRLMAAADILVTKAGPATISEACIAGLPMILYDAIPGQESGNVDHVVNGGAGVFEPTPRGVADAVASWLAEGPEGLAHRREQARQLGHPNAVWEIADEVWAHANQPRIPVKRKMAARLASIVGAGS